MVAKGVNYVARSFGYGKNLDPERPSTWPGFFGNSKIGGINVTPESSLGFSAIYACVKLISESIASLPKNIYNKTETGKEINREHDQFYLFKATVNGYTTAFTFFRSLIAQALLWGNGYALIHRNPDTDRPERYELLESKFVTPFLTPDGHLWFKVKKGNETLIIPVENILHLPFGVINGIIGKSPIQIAKDNISMGLAATSFGRKFYEKGTHAGGAIKLKHALKTQDDVERLRNSFREKYQGTENFGEVIVLENEAEFEHFGMPLKDAQFVESRKFQVEEIARIFGVPPHMIGDLSRSTNNNINHQSIEVVQKTYLPIIVALEQEINIKSFRQREFGITYFKIEVNGLLRGDLTTRAEWYKTLYYTGSINSNEIRALEDMNEYEGGDEYFVPTNMIPASQVEALLSGEKKEILPADIQKLLDEATTKPQLNGIH